MPRTEGQRRFLLGRQRVLVETGGRFRVTRRKTAQTNVVVRFGHIRMVRIQLGLFKVHDFRPRLARFMEELRTLLKLRDTAKSVRKVLVV